MRPQLQRVFAERFTYVVAHGVGWIGMAPRHIGRIGRKAFAAVSGIRAQQYDSWHLAAKTVIENAADGALRDAGRGVNAEHGIALPGSRRVGNQRLIQRGIALEAGATRLVLVGQGNVRIGVAENQIVQQCWRYRIRHSGHQARARSKEAVLHGGKCIAHIAPLRRQHRRIPGIVNVAKR